MPDPTKGVADPTQVQSQTPSQNPAVPDNSADGATVESLRKELAGLQSLMGRFTNEIGELRKLKPTQDASQVGPSQDGQPTVAASTEDDMPEPMTRTERKAIDEAWGKLTEDVQVSLLQGAPGKNSKEKLENVRNDLLASLRETMTIVPKSLFETDDPADPSPQTQRSDSYLNQVHRAITGADRVKNVVPAGYGKPSGSFTVLGQGSRPQVAAQKLVPGNGGVLSMVNKA